MCERKPRPESHSQALRPTRDRLTAVLPSSSSVLSMGRTLTDGGGKIPWQVQRTAGCQMIGAETRIDTSRAGRTGPDILRQFLRPGDTLVITRIDRLARSLKNLQAMVHELNAKGVTLKVTEQPVGPATAPGKAFFDMPGVSAVVETNLRRAWQMEGIAAARKRGVYRFLPAVNRAHMNDEAGNR